MKFPLLRVAKLGRTDPEFAMSLISQFPTQPNCLNVSAGADKNFQIELALQKLINVTPLELSIVYHAQALALRLLSDPEYARYAREHADDVLALCLRAGQGELFMKLKSELIRSITLQHMYLALEYCSEQFCVALLKELSSNFTPSEVLGYADPASGNTILHQIAKNGLRTVLLFLAESGVFNFCAAANRKEKLEVLRVKNVDQLSPFALAVLADNLDIAGALYVTPASLSELSDAEFSIVTSPSSTTRAFTAFIHPELYSQPERKIWAVLFPDRDRVLKLFAKAAEVPMRPGCIPVYVPHNVASTSIDYVKRMMDAGAVCMVIQMAMFRRDTFEVAGLLEQKFGVREKLCAGLRGENVWLLSLAYVFVRLGLFPAKREEIEPAITRVHFFNDSACLGLMQALELLKRNSATAYEALKDESRDSVFISPYRFFRQTGKPADGFTFDELDCILPLDGRELKATYYGLDLAQLAVHFAANQFCDSFTAIVLFAQKFDRDLLNRIMSRMNIEHVLTMFLEGVPERLPWAISVFGTEFRLSYDPKTGVIYAGMDETRETAIRLTHSTLAGLIYYALFQGPKMLRIVQQTTDSGKSIARLVLESVVQITHKYSGINIPRKFPKQLRSFYIGKKATGLNTTIRTNRILGRLLSRAFGIPKAKDLMVIAKSGSETPEKMLIPESGLAEILATSLLPDKEKMFSVENEFMQFEIEGGAQMVLKAAERLAEATGRGLAETVCMLFTDQYIFAVAALRDQVWNRQCILRVRVRLQEGAAAACKFESFQPKSSSSGIDVDIAAAEYVFDPVALSKSGPETLEEMNRRLYLDLSLAKLSNFSLSKRRRARNFTFVLDMESVKKCVVPLERRFFKDISFQITKWCDSETNRVLYRISRYKKYAATNPGSSWTRKLPTLGADVTCKIRFVPRSDWDKTPHPWGEYARRSFQACFSSCEGDVPSPKETELIVLVNDRNVEDGNQPELMSVPESYGEYPAARLFYSESTFSRQLIEFWRGTAPILEVDIKGFCELIAVPLSELFAKAGIDTMPIANTRYDNPILLAEDYMLGNGGRVLRDVMRQFFIDFSSLKAHYGVNAKAIMVLFEEDSCLEPEREEEKGLSLPLLDKLIWITDMRISTTEAEVCSLTFKCRLDWKRTGKIVIPTLDDQKEALARLLPSIITKSRGEEPVQAYMSRLCNIYTILDGLISLSTVVDRTLGYRFWKRNRTERNLRLSTLFKDAKVTSFIDRASLIRTLIMLCPERSLPSEEYCKQVFVAP